MSVSYSALQRLHGVGHFGRLLTAYSEAGGNVVGADPCELQIILAEAFLFTGDAGAARGIALREVVSSKCPSERARYQVVLALADRCDGEFASAIRHIHLAVKSAVSTADHHVRAWCELIRFRLLVEAYNGAPLPTHLADARRLVTNAGDPHLTAFLHYSVAIMEGQAGRHSEARRHLEIAASILSRYPHAWFELNVHTGYFCVAWLECEFREARNHLAKARDAAALVSGASSINLQVNQAQLDLVLGNFPAAHEAFARLRSDGRSITQLSAIDGLARLYLGLNQCSMCEELIRQEGAAHEVGLELYPLHWLRACSISVLIKRSDFRNAVLTAERELNKEAALRDKPLAAHLLLLQAEALASMGDLQHSGEKLAKAAEINATSPGNHQGQYYATAARVLRLAGNPLTTLLASRAKRVWRQQRNIWAQVAAADVGDTGLPLRRYTQADADAIVSTTLDTPMADPYDPALLVLNSVASAFEVSHDPELIAAELRQIADVVGCSNQLKIAVATRRVDPIVDRSDCATLQIDHRGTVVITRGRTQDPASAVAASNLLTLVRAIDEVTRFRKDLCGRAALWPDSVSSDDESLFISDEMNSLAATARKIAATPIPVLITGETGTGKEILARLIHTASNRAKATFLPFNCSSGPRDMIDAQLFGHRRGAFTGATEHAPGVIRAATGGTLFLDEIGEAPLDVQPKLLRFLESGEIHPVGEPHPAKVDVRVIAATNVDLDAAVSSGRFREDLFYRLNIVRLHLPALRERRAEIPVFAQHYLRKHARELGKGNLRLAEETMEYLLLYKWPGNVRQLANEMRRMAALGESDAVLMPEHLSSDIVASRRTVPASERVLDSNEVVVRLDQPLAAANEHLERAMIPYALKECAGRVEEAARLLGLSRKGLYLKRLRLGLEVPEAQPKSA